MDLIQIHDCRLKDKSLYDLGQLSDNQFGLQSDRLGFTEYLTKFKEKTTKKEPRRGGRPNQFEPI